ncbi:phytanoyl-CoA dioxygenase family protein [Micromonospora echinospora]|uniref:phytanoyl-CoA dioxygenase family protein n=1 Tax=Micromonospora echinospora TaxID=1877 RepID=UPI00341EF731
MEEHVRRFADEGYTIIGGIFSDTELRRMRAALANVEAKVIADPSAFETRYTANEGATVDTWGVNHVLAPDLYDYAFAEVYEKALLMDFVHAVLGERLRFWGGHALWAPRVKNYELNWHRDHGDDDVYHPSGETTHIYFNICLLADSCFRLVPGSHRRPLTPAEADQQKAKGFAALPGEVIAQCRPGDVLFVNAHSLHRGSCRVGTDRQTLHMSLQPYDEPTGGHLSWGFMRQEGYVDQLPPAVRELMRNAIEWDDNHPLSLAEMRRRLRLKREHKKNRATDDASGGSR